jgi:hypothetical protein
MDNTVLDMFHGLYGPPDGNRKLQVSICGNILILRGSLAVMATTFANSVLCAIVVCSVVAGWLQFYFTRFSVKHATHCRYDPALYGYRCSEVAPPDFRIAPDAAVTTLMQVRVFGLEEQSRMRGLDPKVRTVCACNLSMESWGTHA